MCFVIGYTGRSATTCGFSALDNLSVRLAKDTLATITALSIDRLALI
jgi:hypothetical protein